MLLITGSFYVYAQLNLRIVREQYRDRAQLLIAQNMMTTHWKSLQNDNAPEVDSLVEDLNEALKPDRLREFNWKFKTFACEGAKCTLSFDATSHSNKKKQSDKLTFPYEGPVLGADGAEVDAFTEKLNAAILGWEMKHR